MLLAFDSTPWPALLKEGSLARHSPREASASFATSFRQPTPLGPLLKGGNLANVRAGKSPLLILQFFDGSSGVPSRRRHESGVWRPAPNQEVPSRGDRRHWGGDWGLAPNSGRARGRGPESRAQGGRTFAERKATLGRGLETCAWLWATGFQILARSGWLSARSGVGR